MRITLFTNGTLGDTQPFVALAVRLRQDGHRVKLAARPDFAGLAAERLAEAIREAMTNSAMRQRAAELGRRIQAEDGLGRTIEIFLRYADRWGRVRRGDVD